MAFYVPFFSQIAVESGPFELFKMPTAFPCLKTLTLYRIRFSNAIMVQCALYMIWASRNLQTLNITVSECMCIILLNIKYVTGVCEFEYSFYLVGYIQWCFPTSFIFRFRGRRQQNEEAVAASECGVCIFYRFR